MVGSLLIFACVLFVLFCCGFVLFCFCSLFFLVYLSIFGYPFVVFSWVFFSCSFFVWVSVLVFPPMFSRFGLLFDFRSPFELRPFVF